MFQSEQKVKLPDTDAAGILFFANYFKVAHDVYESFLDEIGFGIDFIINESAILLLIAHSEADYKKSLKLREKFRVDMTVSKLGGASFELRFKFYYKSDQLAAEVKTVHVAVNRKTKKATSLPSSLREKLSKHC